MQNKPQNSQQRPPAQQKQQGKPVTQQLSQFSDAIELRIGSTFTPQLDHSRSYPSISEFIETVDILKYEHYAGTLDNKNQDDYWSAEGIDHFSSDLGIGVSELIVYELKDVWLVMASACQVVDGRPNCAAVTHTKSERHSLEKACRRAGRNARQYLLPLALLRDMLEEAKIERAQKEQKFAEIKAASDNAGVVVRQHRENFDKFCDGPTLVEFAEKILGKTQSAWEVPDWNYLSNGVSNPESDFLKKLSEYVGEDSETEVELDESEDTEESQEEINWEEVAGGIEDSDDN